MMIDKPRSAVRCFDARIDTPTNFVFLISAEYNTILVTGCLEPLPSRGDKIIDLNGDLHTFTRVAKKGRNSFVANVEREKDVFEK